MNIEQIKGIKQDAIDILNDTKKEVSDSELNSANGKLRDMIQKKFCEITLNSVRKITNSPNDFEAFMQLQVAYADLMILLKEAEVFVKDTILPEMRKEV
jgi:hypothetical protein